jgi:hypothetical protein
MNKYTEENITNIHSSSMKSIFYALYEYVCESETERQRQSLQQSFTVDNNMNPFLKMKCWRNEPKVM